MSDRFRPGEIGQQHQVAAISHPGTGVGARGLAGFLNLHKPAGPTSHDLVALVRRLAGIRRVGHAGTLDPLASGVLVLALGQATRLLEYVVSGRKVYRATIRLGVSTSTDDREGETIATHSVAVSEADIRASLCQFVGTIAQRPPAFSAVQVQGHRAYNLARHGVAVELTPRQVQVYRIILLTWQPPYLDLEVECGPGTYIRALARDLGAALGCGGHLAALVRTRSGRFHIEEAVSPEAFEAQVQAQTWASLLMECRRALEHLPTLRVTADESRRLRQGQHIAARSQGADGDGPSTGKPVSAIGPAGELVAIVHYEQEGARWRPHKVVG